MHSAPTAKIIDKLGWIYIQDKKILMARSHNKSAYYIPGGKREAGESDNDALIREIKEELSVALISDSITPMGEFQGQADGKTAGVWVNIRCFSAAFSGEIKPDAEIAEVAWLDSTDEHRCSAVAVKVLNALKEMHLIN
ncbi:NUDIX hydrolase [Serratia sp. NPDC078593]|uniref:NUDIX hydrolase n=1 Tax=unclassified Serratia (in: enterobacteria) TaxID=2647522 RepID=UPI0037D02522